MNFNLAMWYGHPLQSSVQSLEIVSQSKVIGRTPKKDAGQSGGHLFFNLALKSVERGIWLAARCYGNPTQAAHVKAWRVCGKK
ncbi:MAG: hypothetical protein LH606_13920 [Cytophagaceae bacterium]|nr:hypothetical protein [Cytophagaceae bacterium]